MKTRKFVILTVSVLFVVMSCNFFTVNSQPSKETVPVIPEVEDAQEEEITPTETLPPTPTSIPATDTPSLPTDTPEPEAISAEEPTITIGEFSFHIVEVAYDSTALGMAPSNMGASDQIVWVEFELLSGDQAAFESLQMTLTDGKSKSSNAIILASNGMMQMLATVTMTGKKANYSPDAENIAWAYVFSKSAGELYLKFPTGEMIDLTPIMP